MHERWDKLLPIMNGKDLLWFMTTMTVSIFNYAPKQCLNCERIGVWNSLNWVACKNNNCLFTKAEKIRTRAKFAAKHLEFPIFPLCEHSAFHVVRCKSSLSHQFLFFQWNDEKICLTKRQQNAILSTLLSGENNSFHTALVKNKTFSSFSE